MGAVNRFSVNLKPLTNFQKDRFILFGNGAVGFRSDIQQKISVLAHNVHQVTDDVRGRPVCVVFRIAPGIQGNRRIRLPIIRLHIRELSSFNIHNSGTEHEGVMLVIDKYLLAPFFRPVIIISCQLFQIRLEGIVLNPPVKIKQTGTVAVNDLTGSYQPVLQIFFRRLRFAVNIMMIRLRHGGPVKVAANQWFFHIAVKFFSVSQEKPVFRPVGGSAVYDPSFGKFFAQFAQRIPLRAMLPGIPVGDFTPVHLKAVMMLGNRHHIFCPCFFKQIRPPGGIEFFRLEHGNKILIAEVLMGPIGFHMMFKLRGILDIHVSRIPFAAKGGNAVSAPVDKNPEFSLPEPAGKGMGAEGIPVILVFSFSNNLIYLLQIIFHLPFLRHPGVISLSHQSVTTPFCSITLA